jgi:alkanesulfonate monooxygenase SsuD/methylene tetrahydromethanopterin reductase-like flavin-dependent oxidoreductase (luciferase family)
MTTNPAQVLRVGMFLPRQVLDAGATTVRQVLSAMADAGIDHVGASDHVSFHTGWGIDGIIQATALAAAEPRLDVSIGVYLLALRDPVVVSRQLSTFAQLTHGRLELGVGVGGEDPHEYEVCGIDPRTRGARTDEALTVLALLSTGAPIDFDGRFFHLDHARVVPVPERPIPIVIGGRSPAALRRAGRHGDGWLAAWTSADRFAAGVAAVHEAAGEVGRTGIAWRHGFQPWVGLGADATSARAAVAAPIEAMYRLPFERFERFSPSGTPADIASFLRPYVDAGCTRFNLAAQAADWRRAVDGVAEIRSLLLT